MARVTVTVNVRDLTGNDLSRLRHRFDGLSQSINEFSGAATQRNLAAMRQRFSEIDHEVRGLRGHIPEDEFNRLTRQVQRFGAEIQSATGPRTARQFGIMRASLREIERDFTRIGVPRHIPVHVRDNTGPGLRSITRRVGRFVTGPIRGLMSALGGTLSDGIGQGIVRAFKSPTFGALLVTAILGAISMLGAAIAGALVFALGAAFVGLGAFIAFQAKGVREEWAKTLNSLKPLFADAATPMLPVLEHARVQFEQMGKEFAPHLKDALTQAAPFVTEFLDATKHGFQKLGANAWDDLQEAFRVFLKAFGPEWEDFLAELGNSLGALARTVRDHSSEIAMAFRAVLGIINFLIDAINFLANAWVMGIHGMMAAVSNLTAGLALMLDGFLGIIDGMLAGLESVAGVLGLDGPIKQARENFNSLREQAVGRLTEISNQAAQYSIDLDNANKERILRVQIDSWNASLSQAKKELASVPPERQAQLKANIANLERNIASANAQLNSMQKDYYVRIHAYKVGDWAIGGDGPRARGGVTGHLGRAATGGARSNMTLVGEHGPELVNLAPGSHVRSNSDTRRMLGNHVSDRGGSGATIVLQSSGRRADDLLIEILREAIHQRGGDPVTVLGGNRNGR